MWQYIRENKPEIIIILEPRISGSQADGVSSYFRGFDKVKVDARGFSGGIWLWWDPSMVSISNIRYHAQFIHVLAEWNNGKKTWLTAVYAHPTDSIRRELWVELRDLADPMTEPWLVIGDYNEIASIEEKEGGAPFNPNPCFKFRDVLDSCGLIDLGSTGPKFTWRGPQVGGYARVFKRLDRATSNACWRIYFPEASVRVLPRIKSDHHPILLSTESVVGQRRRGRPFRFQIAW